MIKGRLLAKLSKISSNSPAMLERTRDLMGGFITKVREGPWKLLKNRELFPLFMFFSLGCGSAGAAELCEINFDRIAFLSSWAKSGKVCFSNGEYREPKVPGSTTELTVKLTNKKAFGKLEGKEAGAAILVTEPGGSGTFYDLALLVKKEQGWINQDAAFLGDRIKIHSLAVLNEEIVIGMTNHGPADAMCCPNRQVIQRFVLRDGRLIKTNDEVRGTPDPLLIGTIWKWQQTLYSNDRKKVPPTPENYTLKLQPDGKVSILADCNLGGGGYTLRGAEIFIEINYTTRAACPPDSLEQDYIQDLNAVARYFMGGDHLHIDLKADTGTMQFMR